MTAYQQRALDLRTASDIHYNCAQAVFIPFAEETGMSTAQAASIAAHFGSGMRMADFFFDNIFTDSMALNRIDNIKRQVSQIRYQVEQHARIVENKVSSVETALSQKRREAEELIVRGENP